MKIIIDNGHGIDTKVKRSPDGRLLEYAQNRLLAGLIVSALQARGLDASLLVPEETDISLPERCRRVNEWCRQLGKDNVLLISNHCNAAGRSDLWYDATGWCAYTTRGNTRADALATSLYNAAQAYLPGQCLRTDYTDADPDLEKDFYLLRHTSCPAVRRGSKGIKALMFIILGYCTANIAKRNRFPQSLQGLKRLAYHKKKTTPTRREHSIFN